MMIFTKAAAGFMDFTCWFDSLKRMGCMLTAYKLTLQSRILQGFSVQMPPKTLARCGEISYIGEIAFDELPP